MVVCNMTDGIYPEFKGYVEEFVNTKEQLLQNVDTNITVLNASGDIIKLTVKKRLNNKQCVLPNMYKPKNNVAMDKEEKYTANINRGMYVGTKLEGRYWKMTPFFLPQYKYNFTLTRKIVGSDPTTVYIIFYEKSNSPNDYSNFVEYNT